MTEGPGFFAGYPPGWIVIASWPSGLGEVCESRWYPTKQAAERAVESLRGRRAREITMEEWTYDP